MTDIRNLVLLMGTDGVNPFARERVTTYSLWPIVFFIANLSRDVRYKVRNTILGGLVSGHIYVDGVKKNRSVSNLNLYIEYFVKEVLKFNEDPVRFVDVSFPVGSPRRVFYPSVLLLGLLEIMTLFVKCCALFLLETSAAASSVISRACGTHP